MWLLNKLFCRLGSTSRKFMFTCLCWQGQGQYTKSIKTVEDDIQTIIKRVNELTGIKESDTGLAAPALWDLAADKQTLQNEQPLQVSAKAVVVVMGSEAHRQ
jgi:26S proteasome regulatory subunit T1